MRFPIKIGLPTSNKQLFQGMKNGLIRDVIGGSWWWRQRLRLRDFTPEGDTSQTIVFATLFPNNPFPLRVIRKSVLLWVESPMVGPSISAATAVIGDTNDPNGLMELAQGDIFTAGMRQDLTATEIAAGEQYEGDFVTDELQTTIVSTGANLSVMTALDLVYMVEFTPTMYTP
jgi:hypothetical protein